jgi:hypothetical protein
MKGNCFRGLPDNLFAACPVVGDPIVDRMDGGDPSPPAETPEMPRFFNNCRCRDHASLYGPDAFYDLNLTGLQATKARDIAKGDECVVATPDGNGNIVFAWLTFTRQDLRPNPTANGERVRVFYGTHVRSKRLTKTAAARTQPYAIFFDKRGNFKHPSVITPSR